MDGKNKLDGAVPALVGECRTSSSLLGGTDCEKVEPAAEGLPGGAGQPPAALPCLNTINCNDGKKERAEKLSSGHRKTAFALKLNVLWMIEKHGLERIGFLTLTFARHVVAYKEAQKSLHSLMTGVLKRRYREYITVMERMDSKRIHYHLLVVVAEDIRTGFDFTAVKRGDYRSATPYLRAEWKFWRATAPKYGFGRTELLPIKKTAEGVAKYVGKYVAKHIGQRLPEDKGARLVRYSKQANRAGTSFSWNSPGGRMWRAKLGAFCGTLGLTSDNHKEHLKKWFGKNWVYILRPLIQSVKLPEFYSEAESKDSLRAAWLMAVRIRERRHPRKWCDTVANARPFKRVVVQKSPQVRFVDSTHTGRKRGGRMKEEQNQFLRLLGQVPARLTAEQVACMLNCQPHDVPILVVARLLKPLGNPQPNSVKYFAAAELLEQVKDRAWLAKVTNAVNQYWQRKNAAKTVRERRGVQQLLARPEDVLVPQAYT